MRLQTEELMTDMREVKETLKYYASVIDEIVHNMSILMEEHTLNKQAAKVEEVAEIVEKTEIE